MDHLLYTLQRKGLVTLYQQLQKYFITESPFSTRGGAIVQKIQKLLLMLIIDFVFI